MGSCGRQATWPASVYWAPGTPGFYERDLKHARGSQSPREAWAGDGYMGRSHCDSRRKGMPWSCWADSIPAVLPNMGPKYDHQMSRVSGSPLMRWIARASCWGSGVASGRHCANSASGTECGEPVECQTGCFQHETNRCQCGFLLCSSCAGCHECTHVCIGLLLKAYAQQTLHPCDPKRIQCPIVIQSRLK